jgi:type II secretory pathway pseudopilin PulG
VEQLDLKQRVSGSSGFTMIELVWTIFVITLVIGALALMFAKSNDSAFSSQRDIAHLSVLDQRIEKIRQLIKQYGFSALALTSTPSGPTDSPLPSNPTNPDDFVGGSGCAETFKVMSNYNSSTESFPTGQTVADSPESMLVNGCTVAGNQISGGQLAPLQYVDLSTGSAYASSSSVPAGDPYDTIYTFVTQTSMVGCNTSLSGSCTGDVRRVILAALPTRVATDIGPAYPIYISTIFANPVASNQAANASGLRILGLIP